MASPNSGVDMLTLTVTDCEPPLRLSHPVAQVAALSVIDFMKLLEAATCVPARDQIIYVSSVRVPLWLDVMGRWLRTCVS